MSLWSISPREAQKENEADQTRINQKISGSIGEILGRKERGVATL